MLRCLTEKRDEIKSEACRKEVFYFEKMEVSNFHNDVILAAQCRADVETFCKDVPPGVVVCVCVWGYGRLWCISWFALPVACGVLAELCFCSGVVFHLATTVGTLATLTHASLLLVPATITPTLFAHAPSNTPPPFPHLHNRPGPCARVPAQAPQGDL